MTKDFFVHDTAEVNPKATIGAETKIWNNVQIRENCAIGKECVLSKDVYIDTGVDIGDRCKVQNSVSIYQGVTIEDDVFVGPNVSFTNDKVPRAFNKDWEITKTLIKKGASLGANSTILCGIVIGEYAMIAAGSVVTKDVDSFTLVVGNPARPVAKIDMNGDRVKQEQE